MTYKSVSVEDTEKFAYELAKKIKPGTVLALFGGMGMGKTAFTRGLAKGLGIDAHVCSPTFAIVNDYGGNPPLAHFDMYRVDTWDDLYSTGFFDYIDSGYILSVEWSENIENALPPDAVKITLHRTENENERLIDVEGL